MGHAFEKWAVNAAISVVSTILTLQRTCCSGRWQQHGEEPAAALANVHEYFLQSLSANGCWNEPKRSFQVTFPARWERWSYHTSVCVICFFWKVFCDFCVKWEDVIKYVSIWVVFSSFNVRLFFFLTLRHTLFIPGGNRVSYCVHLLLDVCV